MNKTCNRTNGGFIASDLHVCSAGSEVAPPGRSPEGPRPPVRVALAETSMDKVVKCLGILVSVVTLCGAIGFIDLSANEAHCNVNQIVNVTTIQIVQNYGISETRENDRGGK